MYVRYAVRYESSAGAGHNTESQATDGTITKAFTVADNTFEPQAFVFHVAVSIETLTASTYVPVQEGRVGQLHTCMAFTSREACDLVLHRRSPWVCLFSICSAIGTARKATAATRAVSYLATGCCCATRLHLSAVNIITGTDGYM